MRLFIAVPPPSDVIDAIDALPRPSIEGVRWTTRDQWHVTLRFLGEVDEAEADSVASALADVARATPSCTAAMGPVTTAVGTMVWAPVDGLGPMATEVVDATASVGAPPEHRRFRGHVTLARGRGRDREVRRRLHALAGEPIDVSWDASSFDLVRSELRPEGARYAALASFSLTG